VQVSLIHSGHNEFHEPVGSVFNAHGVNQCGAPKWSAPLDLCAERFDWTDLVEVLEELARHPASPAPHPVLIAGPDGAGTTVFVAAIDPTPERFASLQPLDLNPESLLAFVNLFAMAAGRHHVPVEAIETNTESKAEPDSHGGLRLTERLRSFAGRLSTGLAVGCAHGR
jgi:hypothetical protein